jgi:hypothetical protein
MALAAATSSCEAASNGRRYERDRPECPAERNWLRGVPGGRVAGLVAAPAPLRGLRPHRVLPITRPASTRPPTTRAQGTRCCKASNRARTGTTTTAPASSSKDPPWPRPTVIRPTSRYPGRPEPCRATGSFTSTEPKPRAMSLRPSPSVMSHSAAVHHLRPALTSALRADAMNQQRASARLRYARQRDGAADGIRPASIARRRDATPRRASSGRIRDSRSAPDGFDSSGRRPAGRWVTPNEDLSW